MMKVIVADDERIQREGIARHVPWQELNMELVGCAEDGEEALSLMERHDVDILITDIMMPGITGLELSRRARDRNPRLKIMMISGYDEFEFARSAIELNTYSYMLKPISHQQLIEKLAQLGAQLEQSYKSEADMKLMRKQVEESRQLLQDKLAKDLFFGHLKNEDTIRNRAELLSFAIPESGCNVVLLQLEDIPERDISGTAHQLLMLDLHNELRDLLAPGNQGMVFLSKENELIVLLFRDSVDESRQLRQLDEMKASLQRKFPHRITVSVSGTKKSFTELQEGYREAEAASRQKFYLGKGNTIYYSDMEAETLQPASWADRVEQLMAEAGMGQSARIEEHLDAILRHIPIPSGIREHALRSFCFQIVSDIYKQVYAMNEKLETIFGEKERLWESVSAFDTIPEAREWLATTLTKLAAYIYNKRSRKHANVVGTIIDVLENNYAEPITIEELARKVYLTPNYICNIFKENVGESIIDYLTKVRMKHARTLLTESNCKIYEIAARTGFNNTSYFSAVFKNMFGVSPKEFRDTGLAGTRDR